MGKCGHVARKIAATLASTGTPALLRPSRRGEPRRSRHGQPEDVIIALSWSGETTELADIVAYATRFRVPLDRDHRHAGEHARPRRPTSASTLPKATEACPNGLAPTTSTTMQLALGDALAIALLEAAASRRSISASSIPAASSARSLRFVRDIMHTRRAAAARRRRTRGWTRRSGRSARRASAR